MSSCIPFSDVRANPATAPLERLALGGLTNEDAQARMAELVRGLERIKNMSTLVRPSMIRGLLALAALVAVQASVAQRASDFQALKQAVSNRLLPFNEFETPATPLVDCSWVDADTLDRDPSGSGRMQYIYNATYSWKLVSMNDGLCVFLAIPDHRGLSRDDASVLLSAGNDPTKKVK